MSDLIRLLGVTARGVHGVLPHEKVDGQTFVVDVVIETDHGQAGRTDDLRHTIDYSAVAAEVIERIEGPSLDLIEALAEQIAGDVLARPLARAVEVTVHKPEAPVGVPFSDVQVVVRRRRAVPVVVAMGANLGHPRHTLAAALADLTELDGLTRLRVSRLVESDPIGGPEQSSYLNAVAVAVTDLAPERLLAALHEVEERHGRVREVRWGPRTLDLDLIAYGVPGARSEVRSDSPDLLLPHPGAADRAFVLVPWAHVDPEALVRVGDQVEPLSEVLARADRAGVRPGPAWPHREREAPC